MLYTLSILLLVAIAGILATYMYFTDKIEEITRSRDWNKDVAQHMAESLLGANQKLKHRDSEIRQLTGALEETKSLVSPIDAMLVEHLNERIAHLESRNVYLAESLEVADGQLDVAMAALVKIAGNEKGMSSGTTRRLVRHAQAAIGNIDALERDRNQIDRETDADVIVAETKPTYMFGDTEAF